MHICEVKFTSEERARDSQGDIQNVHSKTDSWKQTGKFLVVIIYC